jgi:outer membrane lipoprotein SlyB
MKKFLVMIMMMAMLAVMMPLAASAQTYTTRRVYSNGRYRYVRVYRNRTFYQKHRNKVNVALGTGAGALIGGIAKGKKGAGIGALIGGGGSALYTYKLRKRHRNY